MRRCERPTVPAPYTRMIDEVPPAAPVDEYRRGAPIASDGVGWRGDTIPMPFEKGWNR